MSANPSPSANARMNDAQRAGLRTLLWLPLPALTLAGGPWLTWHLAGGPLAWPGTTGQWVGVWLMVNGLGLGFWCVSLFTRVGLGTPLPFDPPKRFVLAGPYRRVRNPMMLAAWLIVGGQALAYRSWAVAGYWLAFMVVGALLVRFVEEPALLRRYGQNYRTYQRQVPRWVPRRQPVSVPETRKKR